MDRETVVNHRFRNPTPDTFGNRGDVRGALPARQHDQHLVATNAADDVEGAYALTYPRGDRRKYFITNRMPPGVVDLFEVIDIAKKDAQMCTLAAVAF